MTLHSTDFILLQTSGWQEERSSGSLLLNCMRAAEGKRTKGFSAILRSVVNIDIDLISYYVIGLLQIEKSLH